MMGFATVSNERSRDDVAVCYGRVRKMDFATVRTSVSKETVAVCYSGHQQSGRTLPLVILSGARSRSERAQSKNPYGCAELHGSNRGPSTHPAQHRRGFGQDDRRLVGLPLPYPRIAWVIPRHQGGLIRHVYIARLWPTINAGSA